jgi:hypothetical protein
MTKKVKPFDIIEVKHLVMHEKMISETWKPVQVIKIIGKQIDVQYFKPVNDIEFISLKRDDFGNSWR